MYRPERGDDGTWCSVVSGSEYGPVDFRDRTVLDLGAHIGAFSYLALSSGAKHVVAIEPQPQNFELLERNLSRFAGRYRLERKAVWFSPGRFKLFGHDYANSGGYSLFFSFGGQAVEVETISNLGEVFGGVPDIVKIDVEGAEYAVLGELVRLGPPFIVGEFHNIEPVAGDPIPSDVFRRPFTPQRAVEFLSDCNYAVSIFSGDHIFCRFRATRKH